MDIKTVMKQALEEMGLGRQTPPAPPTPVPPQDERLSALEAEQTRLAQELAAREAELAQAREDLAKATGESAQTLAQAQQERIKTALSGLATSFRITPATQEAFASIAAEHPEAVELCLPALESLQPLPQLTGGTSGEDARAQAENLGGSADADRLHNLTLARMKQTGEKYSVAYLAVGRENPELAASVHETSQQAAGVGA